MVPKRLVLMAEGDGDREALPVLVKRLLTEKRAWDCLRLDERADVMKVGAVERLTGRAENRAEWLRFINYVGLKRNVGAVLVVLDGDADAIEGKPFCPADVARTMVSRATAARAGEAFSLACVFAMQEFESWLIAGIESLAGRPLPGGRPGVAPGITFDLADVESAPRDAKGWLRPRMVTGYKPMTHQAALTSMVDLSSIRDRELRSFRRLENALDQLISGVRTGVPILSPSPTPQRPA